MAHSLVYLSAGKTDNICQQISQKTVNNKQDRKRTKLHS